MDLGTLLRISGKRSQNVNKTPSLLAARGGAR